MCKKISRFIAIAMDEMMQLLFPHCPVSEEIQGIHKRTTEL